MSATCYYPPMDKEFIKSHIENLQGIENRVRDINRFLAVLSKYCESQAEKDEVYDVSLLINMLYDNTSNVAKDLTKILDDTIANFLI